MLGLFKKGKSQEKHPGNPEEMVKPPSESQIPLTETRMVLKGERISKGEGEAVNHLHAPSLELVKKFEELHKNRKSNRTYVTDLENILKDFQRKTEGHL